MASTRRTFLKGTAASGATLAVASRFKPLEVLAAENGKAALSEDLVPTTCWIGKQDCGILARRVNGRVVKFEGHPRNPLNLGALCPKGVGQIAAVYDPNRVKTPLARTNEKGVAGEWRQISWNEALDTVAKQLREYREKDPELILWQKGRSKAKDFYDKAFVDSAGIEKLGHGAYCSDAGYRAAEYTIGCHGVLQPDMRHSRYVLAWGWNATGAGGNKFCYITWPRQLSEARERGMKVVALDPRLRATGPHADEWVPLRPATDLAFALALCNGLIQQGTIDREYLAEHTNSPWLVKEDGTFLREGGKEQVWDTAKGAIGPVGSAGKAALEGTYTVGGETVKPAFQVFKEHVAKRTPEWAAEVCGVEVDQIRRIIRDLGDNAMIGKTIEVDGVRLPYRPVGVMAYHMAQQEEGFQAVRAQLLVFMLLGAIGAVGGVRIDAKWEIDDHYQELDEIEIGDPPYDFTLKESKYFPINSGNPTIAAKTMLDPKRYGVEKIPEMAIIHMANPVVSFPNTDVIKEAYKKFKFMTVLSPWLSETADLYADVVLPAATVEKYEGPMKANDMYVDGVSLRMPPMDPLFESRGEIDIYLDLAERAGFLKGKDGYLDILNSELELTPAHALPLDRRPEVANIFDRWAKSEGIAKGLAYFEEKGVEVKGEMTPEEIYGYAADPVFGGAVHRLYGESLLRYQRQMKAKKAEKIYWQDYTPLPTWREPTMERSPGAYDLYLISFKLVENKQSRSSFTALLAELMPEQRLHINPDTAKERGIGDGDEVWVEANNAVTGGTARLKVKTMYTQAIRPDTVGMPHHFGLWVYPGAKEQGPTPNVLFQAGEGYVACTADQSFHVKVQVRKA